MKTISFFLILLLCACGAKGEYCSTVPSYYGECQDGYRKVSLESGGKCMIKHCGELYTNYGVWSETEEGIIISNVHGDFSTYNGTYIWVEHNNARGPGESGSVLKLIGSGENGTQLFPL
jgi:hypothetical protein